MAALVVGCGVLGLAVGWFVNLLIDRVPGRLSLLPLRGPARSLSVPQEAAAAADADSPPTSIGIRTRGSRFLVHGASGLIFAATAIHFGTAWVLPAYLVFFTSLLAISVIDFDHQIIPNRIIYPTIGVSVPLLVGAAALDGSWNQLRGALIGAVLAWGALFAIHLISPGGMGFGDVRLSFILGLFLGWIGLSTVLIGLFLGFLLGAFIGFALIALHLRTRHDHIPFGPFLAAGASLAVFFGGSIGRWWLPGA